jgi:hypothetical protein
MVKHNESPYASMSNNPIWFGDKDGQDTLMMHRSPLQTHHNGATFFIVTFSYIKNGIESEIDLGRQMIMVTNEYWDNNDSGNGLNIDNGLLKHPYYKLSYAKKMSGHISDPSYDNSIEILGTLGVYIHPWRNLGYFMGCKGITFEPNFDEIGNVETSKEASMEALASIRKVHNSVKKNLTGDKFLLKTNSNGVQQTQMQTLPFIKSESLQVETNRPEFRIYSQSEVINTALDLTKNSTIK